MTIRRRDTTAGQPVRRPLGHVNVNIDDLRALMEMLTKRDDVESDVVVEFDEGEFDEADDMRELGDANLRELRVKAGGLVVHLTEKRAEAIGPPALTECVDNAWARSRQVKNYPASWGFMQKYPYKSAPPLFAALILYVGWMLYLEITEPRKVILFLLIIALLGFMCWMLYASNKKAYDLYTWAVIQPVSAHEAREAAKTRTMVPLWALIVAILAFLASTTIAILNYLKPS